MVKFIARLNLALNIKNTNPNNIYGIINDLNFLIIVVLISMFLLFDKNPDTIKNNGTWNEHNHIFIGLVGIYICPSITKISVNPFI